MLSRELLTLSTINAGGFLLALLASILIARAIGSEGIGLFQLLVQVASVLTVIGLMGADQRVLKAQSDTVSVESNRYGQIISGVLLRAAIISLGLQLFSLAFFLSDLDARRTGLYFAGIMALYVPLQTLLELSYARFKIEFRLLELGLLRDIGRPFLTIMLLIAVLAFCARISAEGMFLLAGLVILLLLCVAIWRLPLQRVNGIQICFSWQALKPDNEMWHLMAGSLCYPLVLSILLAIFSRWMQLSEAGVFAVVCSLALITLVPLNMINQASIQTFSHLRGDPAGLKRAFTTYRNRALLLGAPIALGLIVAGRTLLTLWGDNFETGALALSALNLIYAISILAGSSGNFLISQESSSQHFVGNIIFIGTALILGLALIPTFGLIGGVLALGFALLTQRSYWRWRVQAYFRTEEST